MSNTSWDFPNVQFFLYILLLTIKCTVPSLLIKLNQLLQIVQCLCNSSYGNILWSYVRIQYKVSNP